MLCLLFPSVIAYGILSAEAGIAFAPMMMCVTHYSIGFSKPAQYFYSFHGGSVVHRHNLNSFVGMSRISLQMRKGKGYAYRKYACPMFR